MYSYSSLSLYKTCPYKYFKKYFTKEVEPASPSMQKGIDFHKLIAMKNIDLVADLYDPEIIKAVRMLKETEEYKSLKIIKTEAKIRQEVDGHNFFAIIDCLAKTKDGKDLIIDWKYTKGNWTEENEEQYAIQKALYKKITGITEFWFVNITKHKTPRIEFLKDSKEMEWSEVLNLIKKLNGDFHYIPKDSNSCFWCCWKQKDCSLYF